MKILLCILVVLLVLSATGATCKKNNTMMKEAVITGFDSRMCPCCGGLMISFSRQIQPYSGDFFLIENNPAEFGIDSNTTFPVHVSVEYKNDPDHCSGNMIKITKFAKR